MGSDDRMEHNRTRTCELMHASSRPLFSVGWGGGGGDVSDGAALHPGILGLAGKVGVKSV